MKTKPLLLLVLPVMLVSCKNPADETTSATVSEAVTPAETSPAETATGIRYALQPGSEVLFIGSKVTGSHEGGFKTLSGSFSVADGKLVGTGQKITIDMNSVWSDDENLTAHLKNQDFFHVEKYPQAVFELTSLTPSAEGAYEVSGNLTLTGTTKNITFPATAALEGETAKIHAKFDINRKDFGIVYAGKADDLIRDEVVIELKLQAAPDAAADT